MNEIKTLSLADLLQFSPLAYQMATYNKNVLVAANPIETVPEMQQLVGVPVRMEAYMFVIVWEGELNIQCDLQDYHLMPYSMLVVNPRNRLMLNRLESCRMSLFVIDNSFFQSLHFEQRLLLPRFTEMTALHHYSLSRSQAQQAESSFRTFEALIRESSEDPIYHQLLRSLTQSIVWLVTYQLLCSGAVFSSANFITNEGLTVSESEQFHFKTFVHNLSIHFRQHHNVAYYAELQHITPKYLSVVVNHVSGRTPRQWIDDQLMQEIRHLLQHSDMSVKQIAAHLCFANESFFGKYFKRKMGISPGSYRFGAINPE